MSRNDNRAPPQHSSADLITQDPSAFAAAVPAGTTLLALDVSRKRIGVAGCDAERRLVTPLLTVERKGRGSDLRRLGEIVRQRRVGGFVLGHPVNMDGTLHDQDEAIRGFARILVEHFGLPVLLQDERLTSFAVEAAIEEGRVAAKPGEPVDHLAAAVILEDALRAMS
ncbi:MAG: Holliday junction resolvase RuvX [Geminicoccaceae bacterium]